MTFSEWRELSAADAAREIHQRVQARLSPAQQRATLTDLPDEEALEKLFAAVPRNGPLAGVPYILKDLYPVAGKWMFAGSTFLPEVRPAATTDSTLVRRLRENGAMLAGRAHLHEFAYGITGENPHYGDCEHPHFPGRVTGGSSSGSAALVSAGIVPLATGSDTGGSVRLPAAFCGLYGFRLTPGDEFISDALPLAPSYDTAGWFTANGADMLTAIDALIGITTEAKPPRGLYLELPGLNPEVAIACRNAALRMTSLTDPATTADLANVFSRSVDTYNAVVADEAWRIHHKWADRFKDSYDPGVWQRLNRVHSITHAQRTAARDNTSAIKSAWTDYFQSYDFLLLPASPFPALTKAECTLENRTRILHLTAPASIGGLPVVSLPVKLPSGLTTGLQVVVASPKSPAIKWVLEQH